MISPTVTVTAFADWNAQIHGAKPARTTPKAAAETTLAHVGRRLGHILNKIDSSRRYDVSLRLYHGWFRGFEASANRRAVTLAISQADFPTLSRKANVIIRPEVSYGDRLLFALTQRLNARLGIHLPNTLRWNERAYRDEEKMVDTALATDVIDLAHREPGRWIVVMADDDDFLPCIFAAESILSGQTGKVFLVRDRGGGPFFDLDDLWVHS